MSKDIVSNAIIQASQNTSRKDAESPVALELAQPIQITRQAFDVFVSTWKGVSDEQRAQLFYESLTSN